MEELEIALQDLRFDLSKIRDELEDILKELTLAEYKKSVMGEIEDIKCILFDIDQDLASLEDEAAHQNFLDRQEDQIYQENEWR